MKVNAMAKKATKKPKRAYTKGGVPQAKEVAKTVQVLTTCPKCKSTSREGYSAIKTMDLNGNKVSWKRTKCKDCGQRRMDKTIEALG